jgi:transcriptional regulator with XRE-family HTH domain
VSSHNKLSREAAWAFGLRLKNLGMDFGRTQAEVAGLACISRDHCSALEPGHADYGDRSPSNPTIASILELAHVYRIDPKELIDLVITNGPPISNAPLRQGVSGQRPADGKQLFDHHLGRELSLHLGQ